MKRLSILEEAFSLDLPYSDRQRIVIVPDAEIKAQRQIQALAADEPASVLRTIEDENASVGAAVTESRGAEFARGLGRRIGGVRVRGERMAHQVGSGIARRARGRDSVAAMIGRSEARVLRLDQGHPLDNVLYVGHPKKPDLYFAAADFHRRVFEHKFVEAINLLMSLGASRIVVEQDQGYSRDSERMGNLPIAFVRNKTEESRSGAAFEAEFPGSGRPVLPEDLSWFEDEETWRMIAKARIASGAEKTSLNVTYTTDYGINRQVAISAARGGLELGGKFKEQRDTVWRLDAEFPPLSG
jgi:hypothetical protein